MTRLPLMAAILLAAPLPAPPSEPAPLEVEGFEPASHVGPDDVSGRPMPVTVVLHGNFDRPEWECASWKAVAGFYGWILCPRGIRTPWASRAEDRWTYRSGKSAAREIEAGLAALAERYPGQVSDQGRALVGFSLGAMFAPRLASEAPGRYAYLFLVEGGVDKMDRVRLRALRRAGVKGIGMAASGLEYRRAARDALKRILGLGMRAVFVDMRGAGHGYGADFDRTGRKAFEGLTAP